MSHPKISILTPVKNAEPWIKECIDSVLIQDCDWQWILVDDGCTDQTIAIIESYRDERIEIHRNTGHGIIPALATGLTHCRDSFVTRMDADDVMPDQRLLQMSQALEDSPEKTVVTGLVRYFADTPLSKGYLSYENWLNEINVQGNQWSNIYRECVIASPNWMVRKEELEQSGGFKNLQYPEDYDLTFRWYENDFSITSIPSTTLFWREHRQRTSRNSDHYHQKSFFRLKISRFLQIDHNQEPIIIWGKNVKSTLTTRLLTAKSIPFELQDIKNYKALESYPKSQLLIAVYPEANKRDQIEAYLRSIGRIEGDSWWYL
ncbi:MAG: glycosyltransferase family A protein [Marinoscillum sp.]